MWFGWLPATGGAFETVTIWGSSMVCVVACWLATQPRVHGYVHLIDTSPRGRHAGRSLIFYYVGSAGLVGYGVVGLVMTVAPSLLGGTIEGPWATFIISAATTLVSALFWTALGITVGQNVPMIWGIAIAGVIPYAWFAVEAIYFSNGPTGVFALGGGRVFDYWQPNVAAWTFRLLAWTFATVALAAGVFRARRTSTWSLWATSATAAVTMLAGADLAPIPGANSARCAGRDPIVCTDRAHAFVLPAYAATTRRAVEVLPEPARPFAVLQESVPAPPGSRRSFTIVSSPVSGNSEPSAILSEDQFIARLGDTLFGDLCSGAGVSDGRRLFAVTALQIWWREEFSLPLDGSSFPGERNLEEPALGPMRNEAKKLSSMNISSREKWLSRNIPLLATCSSENVELP